MMKLAVIFPGIGYHCDKPLLYYARKLAQECGYEDIIILDYICHAQNIRGDQQKMQQAFDTLYLQAEKGLRKIDFASYDDILFVSKSVGTIIGSAYAGKHAVHCRHILYTPLEQTYVYEHSDAIAFMGSADPWVNTLDVQQLSASQHVPIYVYEGADHSMETGDCLKNIEILQEIMKTTVTYMRQQ